MLIKIINCHNGNKTFPLKHCSFNTAVAPKEKAKPVILKPGKSGVCYNIHTNIKPSTSCCNYIMIVYFISGRTRGQKCLPGETKSQNSAHEKRFVLLSP